MPLDGAGNAEHVTTLKDKSQHFCHSNLIYKSTLLLKLSSYLLWFFSLVFFLDYMIFTSFDYMIQRGSIKQELVVTRRQFG